MELRVRTRVCKECGVFFVFFSFFFFPSGKVNHPCWSISRISLSTCPFLLPQSELSSRLFSQLSVCSVRFREKGGGSRGEAGEWRLDGEWVKPVSDLNSLSAVR